MGHIPRSPIANKVEAALRNSREARGDARAAASHSYRLEEKIREVRGGMRPVACPTCGADVSIERYNKDDGRGQRKSMFNCAKGHPITVIQTTEVNAPTR